jgi:tripartite-type tricarboxylate transporter receptor subunit TctC
VDTTAGLYGPKTMPRALRERIAKDVSAVAAEPAITERIVAGGQAMNLGGPDDLEKTIDAQAAQMATVAQTLGLKAAQASGQ